MGSVSPKWHNQQQLKRKNSVGCLLLIVFVLLLPAADATQTQELVLLPPTIIPRVPVNTTQELLWRPTYHTTGAFVGGGAGHLQDPAAPFQDANGLWHVFPDCWPSTWNDAVEGGGGGGELGWCHVSSPDLVHWTSHPPVVWFGQGKTFGGNCGTGGGGINAAGEYVVYCPHDISGVNTFVHPNATNLNDGRRFELVDRPPPGKNCSSSGWSPGCAFVPPPPSVMGKDFPSDPGTPWKSSVDGAWWNVWGNRGGPGALVYALRETPAAHNSTEPAGSLRHFEYNSTFFSTPNMPPQRCEAYADTSIRNCTAQPEPASVFECPDTFELGGRQVLLGSLGCSSLGAAAWWSGHAGVLWPTAGGAPMEAARQGLVDFGNMYAPKSAASFDGKRRVLFGWVMEQWCDAGCRGLGGLASGCTAEQLPHVSFDGALSLPRELTIDSSDGSLLQAPVAEVALLRLADGAVHRGALTIVPANAVRVASGRALEINVMIDMPAPGSIVGIDVLSSASEATTVTIDGSTGKASIVLARSSAGTVGARLPVRATLRDLTLEPGDTVDLRIFVDHSILEVFVNSVRA